jgi:hypothetical protein
VFLAHCDAPIPALRDRRPDVSEELDSVYTKMVAKRPEDRYQTMTEAIAALECCLTGEAAEPSTLPRSDLGNAAPTIAVMSTQRTAGAPSAQDQTLVSKKAPGSDETLAFGAGTVGQDTDTSFVLTTAAKPPRRKWLFGLVGASLAIVAAIVAAILMKPGSEAASDRPTAQPEANAAR